MIIGTIIAATLVLFDSSSAEVVEGVVTELHTLFELMAALRLSI